MFKKLLLTVAITLGAATGAHATSDAFIGIGSSSSWGRDLTIQETFESDLGFESVRLNADVTPSELPALASAFLSRPGAAEDRRFVWISGPGEGTDSPCPTEATGPIAIAAPTLLLVPECYAGYLSLPSDALHISLRALSDQPPSTIADLDTSTAAIVLITLPSDQARVIAAADRLILETLRASKGGTVIPAMILQQLRRAATLDGSDYTPTLEATPSRAAWSRRFLTPSREKLAPHAMPQPMMATRRNIKLPIGPRAALYSTARSNEVPAVWFSTDTPVAVIRHNRDGSMVFVHTADKLYGWMKRDALED